MLSMHPNLSEKERKSLEAMTLAIINKILHDPLTQLKKRDEDIVAELYIDAIRTLFQLSSTNTNISKEEEEINARI